MTAVPRPRRPEHALPIESFIDETTLTEVLSLAWVTFVDREAVLVPAGAAPDGTGLVAEVAVVGDAPARIALAVDGAGARAVTEHMTSGAAPGPALDDEDIADALGELANVLGGNLKALLPEGSTLSLPSVAPSAGPVPAPTGDDVPAHPAAVVTTLRWRDHLVTATVTGTPTPKEAQL